MLCVDTTVQLTLQLLNPKLACQPAVSIADFVTVDHDH